MKLKFTILTLLTFIGVGLSAQNRTLKTFSEDKVLEDEIGYTPIKETYTYYVGEYGEKIKHGSFSRIGKKSGTNRGGYQEGTQTCNYSVKATYKDGKLNGTLVGSRTCTATLTNHLTGSVQRQSIKESFTGGYLDGIPNGLWKSSKVIDGQTLYSVTMTFKKGMLVGSYSFSESGNTTRGSFDSEGRKTGKWTYNSNSYTFDKGVELRTITRATAQDDIDIRAAQDRYVKGEVTLEELHAEGYTVLEKTKRERSGYESCMKDNYLWLHEIMGDRTRYDAYFIPEQNKYIPYPIEMEKVLGRELTFYKVHILTDDLLNAALAKMGYDVEADPAILAKIESGYSDETYFRIDFPKDEEERNDNFYMNYAGYVILLCGDEYPEDRYYFNDEQAVKIKNLQEAKRKAEEAKRKAEEEARRKLEALKADIADTKRQLRNKAEAIEEFYADSTLDQVEAKRGFYAGWEKCIELFNELANDQESSLKALKDGLEIADFIIAQLKAEHTELVESKLQSITTASEVSEFLLGEAKEIQKSEDERYEKITKYHQQRTQISTLYQKKELSAEKEFAKDKYYEKSSIIRCYMIIMVEIDKDLSHENLEMIFEIGDMLKQIREPETKDLEKASKKLETYEEVKAFFMNDVKAFVK